MSGTVEVLEFLLSSGISLDTLDASQRTLVHWAAVNGNHTVLSKLLELGASVDPVDALGFTPLHYACQQAAEPTDAAYSEEALVRAQLAQECVRMLLRGGASVECRDPQGYLTLHSALMLPNNLQACQLLLLSGADPEAKTELEGWTGLHLAARRGITESCQLLLEHTGGHLGTVLDQEGASALHHAVGSGSVECLEYLLQAGLSPNQTNAEQRTPSHLAAGAGLTACLQVLQGYGANLGASDAEGATPLHEAAANGHADAVGFLLSSESVNINKGVEQTRATPLHYAVQGGHEECVQLLIDYGAKVNALTLVEEEQLSPLDLCEDQEGPIYQLLHHHGALPGSDVIKDIEATDEHEVGGVEEVESLSVPSVRPTTPSRRSFAASPVFDTLHPDYATTSHPPSRPVSPITPPAPPISMKEQEPGIFRRVFGGRKSRRVAGGKETMLSSVVGLYATQVTMLTAAVLGSPLGDKVKEMAEKVASTTSEDLKKTVITCEGGTPDLSWLHVEEPDAPPTPPGEPTPPPPTPPPPTPPPPIPKVTEDPYDRRLRKAKAQLDMSKSPELLAVEELLKAQNTHMKLKRQFQEAQLKEAIAKRQEDFQTEEHKAQKASQKVMQRLEKQINRAQLESDVMSAEMERQLAQARQENAKLSSVMGALGVCPRPTVAQWLQRKQMERKAKLQDSLISWDRGRQRREAAILVEQAVVSQRAMKHAAWGAKKDIQSKIKKIKGSPYKAVTRVVHPNEVLPTTPTQRPLSKGSARKSPGKQNKVQPAPSTPGAPGRSTISPTAATSTVLATPTGFKKVRGEATPKTQPTWSSERDPTLWKIGEDYVVKDKLTVPLFPEPPTDTYLRATGPKTVHTQRTLHFMSPQEYKAAKAAERAMKKQLNQQYGASVAEQPKPRSPVKSRIVIQAIKFDEKSSEKRGVSFTASPPHSSRYHAHMDALGGGHAAESAESRTSDKNLSILPMNVLESTNLPSVEAS